MIVTLMLTVSLTAAAHFDALWDRFHGSGDPAGRELVWRELQRAGWPNDFDLTVQRLRERRYPDDVPRGVLRESRTDLRGLRYPYIVLVPESVDGAVLLLGIGELDPELPVQVARDGVVTVHRIQASVETLMRWAIRDGDPELLVWGEIRIHEEP